MWGIKCHVHTLCWNKIIVELTKQSVKYSYILSSTLPNHPTEFIRQILWNQKVDWKYFYKGPNFYSYSGKQ